MKSVGDPEQTVSHYEMAPLMLAALAPVMLRTDVTPEQADRTVAALRLLAQQVPELRAFDPSRLAEVCFEGLRSDTPASQLPLAVRHRVMSMAVELVLTDGDIQQRGLDVIAEVAADLGIGGEVVQRVLDVVGMKYLI